MWPNGSAIYLRQDDSCSFDHLVGAERKCRRNVQPERLSGLEVDYQLVLGGRLNRKVGRPFALKDAVDIASRPSPLIDLIGPIGAESAFGCVIPERINRRQAMPRRQ